MKRAIASRWRRARRWSIRTGGLLLALTMVGLTAACSRELSGTELRARATSSDAEARRTAEERTMRALIERITAVAGLEHVLTRFNDLCARPYEGSLLESNQSPYALTCDLRADVYFGVRGDISDVLRRIRATDVAVWGPHDDQGKDLPHAAGTVTYALDYHRNRGRFPDGTLMPAPTLEATGLRIEWDLPDLPLGRKIDEPSPCPPPGYAVYSRCSILPQDPLSVSAARARYGTVLVFRLGGWDSSATDYFTVPRPR